MLEKKVLLLRLCKLAVGTSILNMIAYIAIGYQSAIYICLYGAISALILHWVVLRNYCSEQLSSNIFCLTTFLFFFFFILTSGKINSPIIPWLIMIPIVSFQLFSLWNAIVWTASNIVFLLLLYLAPSCFDTFSNELDPDYLGMVAFISNASMILFVVTVSQIYKNVTEKMWQEITGLTRAEIEQKTSLHYWIKGQEDERKRIASDLHDGLAQQVVAIRFKFYNAIARNKEVHFNNFDQELNEVILEIKRITNSLHPKNLELFGLKRSIELLLEDISTNTNLKCSHQIDLGERNFSPEFSIQLYRIVQECLQNAIKHSGASTFQVFISTEKNNIKMIVLDSGIGISEEKRETGIFHLKERIKYLNGELLIQTLEQGTKLEISLPI
jgi:signal transduction histidine kinase